jgi:hypothetical protein
MWPGHAAHGSCLQKLQFLLLSFLSSTEIMMWKLKPCTEYYSFVSIMPIANSAGSLLTLVFSLCSVSSVSPSKETYVKLAVVYKSWKVCTCVTALTQLDVICQTEIFPVSSLTVAAQHIQCIYLHSCALCCWITQPWSSDSYKWCNRILLVL